MGNNIMVGLEPIVFADVIKILYNHYPEYLNANQACKMLGIKKASLYRLLKTHEIYAYKRGKAYRFRKIDVIEYLLTH